MPPPDDFARWNDLFSRGLISQETFNRVAPEAAPAMTPSVIADQQIDQPPALQPPMADAPMPPPEAPVDPSVAMGNAYAQAYPSAPPVQTTTDGLGARDAAVTNAYAAAYGDPAAAAPAPAPAPVPEAAPPPTAAVNPSASPAPPAAQLPAVNPMQSMVDEAMAPYRMREAGINLAVQAGEARAAEDSAALQNLQKTQAQKLADDGAWAEAQRKRLDEQMQKLAEESENIAKQKVDPKRYWADKSTGDKILAGIALFLGGIGASRTGENQAAKVIMSAIDRDIDLQKADIGSAKDALQRKYTLYSTSLANFKDERVAKDAARVQAIDVAKIGLEASAAKYRAPEVKAKALELMGQLEEQKQKYLFQIRQQLAFKSMMDGAQGGQDINPAMLPPEYADKYVPGYGFAINEKSATKIKERIPDVHTAQDSIGKLIDMAEQSKTGKLSPGQRAEATQIRRLLEGVLRMDLVGPGTIQPAERELIQEIIADPNAIFTIGKELVNLKTLKDRIDYRWKQELTANGLKTRDDMFQFKPAAGAKK